MILTIPTLSELFRRKPRPTEAELVERQIAYYDHMEQVVAVQTLPSASISMPHVPGPAVRSEVQPQPATKEITDVPERDSYSSIPYDGN